MSYHVSKYNYTRIKPKYKKYTITKNNIENVYNKIVEWNEKAKSNKHFYLSETEMWGIKEVKDSYRYCDIVCEMRDYGIHIEYPITEDIKIGSTVYFSEYRMCYRDCGAYYRGYNTAYYEKAYDVVCK